MAFPIRYRLRDKETREVVKMGQNVMLAITPGGQPVIVDHSGFYLSVSYPSTAKYTLEVATEKQDGMWYYQQIGY